MIRRSSEVIVSSVGWNGIADDTAKQRSRHFISQDDERGR